MKYLFYEKETETKAKVVLVYNIEPPKELTDKGNYIILEVVPESSIIKGKSALPYCNPQTDEFWYEYIDRPLTSEEQSEELQDQVNALNIAMAEMMGV